MITLIAGIIASVAIIVLSLRSMRCLFLDLASHDGLLTLVDEGKVLSSRLFHGRVSDHELLAAFEAIVPDPSIITHVACVIGPGGFTSLRVAVSFANTVSFARNIPSAGIHLSDLYQARTQMPDVLWLHSTRKDEVFVRGFGALVSFFPQTKCERLGNWIENVEPGTLFMGELLPEHEKIVIQAGLQRAPVLRMEEILPSFLSSLSFTRAILRPWYGRSG